MAANEQFLIGLQAYQDILGELQQNGNPQSPDSPAEASLISSDPVASFPSGSLLLGLADDKLPVLLDLYDPAPGALLVSGDGGAGKTDFLRSIVQASTLQEPGDIQFAVLTPFPEEWNDQEILPNCLGIWPSQHPSSLEFLSQVVGWAGGLPETRQVVLLLIDGLDLLVGNDRQSMRDLDFLLEYGPAHQVWPVATVNPVKLAHIQRWLELFHTRILGVIRNGHAARLLSNDPTIDPAGLLPGHQFCIIQPNGWLKFLLPPLI